MLTLPSYPTPLPHCGVLIAQMQALQPLTSVLVCSACLWRTQLRVHGDLHTSPILVLLLYTAVCLASILTDNIVSMFYSQMRLVRYSDW